MGTLIIENVDLAELTDVLRDRFAGAPPRGYLDGRTAVRDVVITQLACSELEAENVVDTLIARGFLRYGGDPRAELDDEVWSIQS